MEFVAMCDILDQDLRLDTIKTSEDKFYCTSTTDDEGEES